MIEELQNLPPQQLLRRFNKAIEYQSIQDHIHFRIVRDFLNGGYIPFTPNPKQLEFFETGNLAVERALMAANRFGKSLCAALEMTAHLTLNYPEWWNGYRYDHPITAWAAGVDLKSTNLSLKRYYIGDKNGPGLIHPSLIVGEDKRENSYYVKNKNGDISTLTFKSHDQGADTFQAASVNVIHMDEQYPYAIHSECVTRIAKVSNDFHGMILATFSPIKGTTLLTLHFTQKESEYDEDAMMNVASGEIHNSIVYVNATHDDALHIPEEEKKRLFLSYQPHEREARTKGIPSIGSGLIYPVSESKVVVSPFQIPDYWPRCFGMDFGWHNTAVVFMARDPDSGVVYLYAEYLAGHLTPQHHAYHLIKLGADWMPGAYDIAGKGAQQDDGGNLVDLYTQAGIKSWFPAETGKGTVEKGLMTVLQMLEEDRLKIFSTLTKTMFEYRMYARDDNGKVKKGNDHLLDAIRYGIATALPRARVKSSVMNKLRIPVNSGTGGSWMKL